MKIRIEKSGSGFKRIIPKELPLEAEVEKKKLMIVEDLLEIMEQKGISRAELARRMDVRPSRITSMLNGTNNCTIDTLVRAGRAVGAELHQTFAPVDHKVEIRTFNQYGITDANVTVAKVKKQEPQFKIASDAINDDPAAA